MTTEFQLTVDCTDPDRMTKFWAVALGYRVPDVPDGFDSWRSYWRHVGVPDDELNDGDDRLVDPEGKGPAMWFQQVPEDKVVKNRLHLDLKVSGGRQVPLETRKKRVDAEAGRLVREGATILRVLDEEGLDHYAVAMQDPEGNEFCIA